MSVYVRICMYFLKKIYRSTVRILILIILFHSWEQTQSPISCVDTYVRIDMGCTTCTTLLLDHNSSSHDLWYFCLVYIVHTMSVNVFEIYSHRHYVLLVFMSKSIYVPYVWIIYLKYNMDVSLWLISEK